MKKHLAYYETEWPANITELTAVENKPFVGYLKDGGVQYTVIPVPEKPVTYEAVELFLPSGRLWANMNVGATSPEDAGMYFQWGGTVGHTKEQVEAGEKAFVDWSTYFDTNDNGSTFNKYNNEGGLTQLEYVDDAAAQIMGSDWRMPTKEDFQELVDNTTLVFIDFDGNEFTREQVENGDLYFEKFKGVKFVGVNNNSIFIPTCNPEDDGLLYRPHEGVILWSSNLSEWSDSSWHYLSGNDEGTSNNKCFANMRWMGLPIRGVKA